MSKQRGSAKPIRAATKQKSKLCAQLAVCHCGFKDLDLQIGVLLRGARVAIKGVAVPRADYLSILDNSLSQGPSLVRTYAIENSNRTADVGYTQCPSLNGKLGNFALWGQFRFQTDANKLGHDESSLQLGRGYRPAPLA
jgi:hypothetical protein